MNEKKLALLFALQEHPVAPAAALAKQIGVTPPTTRTWLDALVKERVYVGVQANLRVRNLGLDYDDFLVSVDSYESLTKLEKFCRLHPYTSYRARVFGSRSYRGKASASVIRKEWQQETVVVKGKSQIRYRDLKTGRFMRKPK